MSAKEELPASIKTHLRTIRNPVDRKSFLELYHYIKNMAGDFDVTVSDAELLDILGLDPSTLPDKPSINKRLFQLAQIESSKKNVGDFDPTVVRSLCETYFNNTASKDNLLRYIADANSQIRRQQDTIRSYITQILDYRKQLSLLESGDKTEVFVREMNKLVTSSKFEQIYWHTPSNNLCAVTKRVVIRHGEDIYDFGQYVIAFAAEEKQFYVYPHKDNILQGGNQNHYHPHVFSQRTICWGNANATYAELLTTQKIGDLFLIANMILHAYNPASPVIEISMFKHPTTCKVTRHNIRYIHELPVHTQLIIDLYPEIKADPAMLATYVAKIKPIHNFSYTTVDAPAPRVEEDIFDIEIPQTPVAEVA